MKVAIISYNHILPGQKNGWVNNDLFINQGNLPAADKKKIGVLQNLIDNQWTQLAKVLPQLDKVIVYVGDYYSQYTIQYATEHKLPTEKAIFLFCSCEYAVKVKLLKEHGFDGSEILKCECGGRHSMETIAENFIETGELDFDFENPYLE